MADSGRGVSGTVKFFNDQKGFGFIEIPGTDVEVFVHQSAIKMDGRRTLHEHQPVVFDYDKEEKGHKAKNVEPDLNWADEHAPPKPSYGGGYGDRGGGGYGDRGGGGYGDRGGGGYGGGGRSRGGYDDRETRGHGGGGYDRGYSGGGGGGGGGGYGRY